MVIKSATEVKKSRLHWKQDAALTLMVKLLILITLWRGNKPYFLVGKLQINKDTLLYNC